MHGDGPNNPLHGITLETMVRQLHAHYGWDELTNHVRINCFAFNPTVKSSLTFLRKTPWAREKVERLYLDSMSQFKKSAEDDGKGEAKS
jgi:uncharacterized protein (DUF2132 family)